MQSEPPDTTASPAPWGDFPPVTPDRWRERIRADLKGADLEKLVWHTLDGFAIEPFYMTSGTGERQALRKSQPGNRWLIRQDLSTVSLEETRQQIQEALQGGANSLGLHFDENGSSERLGECLAHLPLGAIAVHLSGGDAPTILLDTLSQAAEEQAIPIAQLTGSITGQTLTRLVEQGKAEVGQALDDLAAVLHKLLPRNANLHAISIDARPYHHAGASVAQELGCTLAAASEYLVQMTERSCSVADIVARMRFEVPVGTSFFPEIAKLRALRLLFTQIVPAFDETRPPPMAFIRADTSRWSLTLYDPHVNLLRATTEATAAILGGCDELSIQPYDAATKQPGAHARRLGLNIQHILKHESHLDVVADPAAGSYFLEHLTDELAAAGWAFFQQIEGCGGLIAALKDGFIQQEIETSRKQRLARIDAGQTVFVGTNAFPHADETRLHDAPADLGSNTSSASLPSLRGPAHFEALRLRTERLAETTGHLPRVLPLMLGEPVMANARATFSRNFFGVAGFEILSEQWHETPEQAASAALETGADIVVLCSADATYTDIAAPICKHLAASEKAPLVVVAGYPEGSLEALRSAGIDAFIHRKTHLLDALTDFQARLGITQ